MKTGTSSRAAAVGLEVWLGPMEGESFSVAASSGSTRVRVGRRRADEKRGMKNDLVLAEGDGVSGFHAEVLLSGAGLRVKDLNSTNGTFVENKRVSGEVGIDAGDIFMLSTTPLQAFLEEVPSPPAPADSDIAATQAFAKMYAAALGSARRRKDGFVDTRHLLDALARSKNAGVVHAFEEAGSSPEKALDALWSGGLFSGPREWMRRFLAAPPDAAATGASPAAGSEPSLSVRVRGIFGAARSRLSALSPAEAEQGAPGALLTALLQCGRGPVSEWLAERGIEPVPLPSEKKAGPRKTSRVVRATEAVAEAHEPTLRKLSAAEEPTSRIAGKPAEPAAEPARAEAPSGRVSEPVLPQVFSTGDVVLDQRARAIASELEEAAAVYRFSTPEDRRSVLKGVVNKALASVAPDNRARILTQIRLQFPIADVPAPPAPKEDVARLQAKIRELERQLEEHRSESSAGKPSKRATAASGPVDWHAILADEPPEGKHSDASLRVLRELVASARRTERFLLGVIQGVTMPGSETASFKLPSHRYTLGAIFSALEQGKEPDGKAYGGLPAGARALAGRDPGRPSRGPAALVRSSGRRSAPRRSKGGGQGGGGSSRGSDRLWNRYREP